VCNLAHDHLCQPMQFILPAVCPKTMRPRYSVAWRVIVRQGCSQNGHDRWAQYQGWVRHHGGLGLQGLNTIQRSKDSSDGKLDAPICRVNKAPVSDGATRDCTVFSFLRLRRLLRWHHCNGAWQLFRRLDHLFLVSLEMVYRARGPFLSEDHVAFVGLKSEP
jgi:hypothetical protein